MTAIADAPRAERRRAGTGTRATGGAATVELLWIPLGAGQHLARLSGKLFETVCACIQQRRACDLYHSALVITVPRGRSVIEMTPVADLHGERRGVVAVGAVGAAWLGRWRHFRYEIRRWPGGVIPDADRAVATQLMQVELEDAQRLLALVPSIPTPVWGRDELDAGEMWNSNSVTSWILQRGGVDAAPIRPPAGGRAPGWDAGLVLASRTREPRSREDLASAAISS